MIILVIPENYFSETTLNHLKPQQGLSKRYQQRALDVTLATVKMVNANKGKSRLGASVSIKFSQ